MLTKTVNNIKTATAKSTFEKPLKTRKPSCGYGREQNNGKD